MWSKTRDGRDTGIEAEAWRRMPTRAPAILAKLLRQGLPVIARDPEPRETGGRPPVKLGALCYQGIIRCLMRGSLLVTEGRMMEAQHLEYVMRPVSASRMCRFLGGKTGLESRKPDARAAWDPDEVLEKVLALSTWPARPYERIMRTRRD